MSEFIENLKAIFTAISPTAAKLVMSRNAVASMGALEEAIQISEAGNLTPECGNKVFTVACSLTGAIGAFTRNSSEINILRGRLQVVQSQAEEFTGIGSAPTLHREGFSEIFRMMDKGIMRSGDIGVRIGQSPRTSQTRRMDGTVSPEEVKSSFPKRSVTRPRIPRSRDGGGFHGL